MNQLRLWQCASENTQRQGAKIRSIPEVAQQLLDNYGIQGVNQTTMLSVGPQSGLLPLRCLCLPSQSRVLLQPEPVRIEHLLLAVKFQL
jgi:hypothetical protein